MKATVTEDGADLLQLFACVLFGWNRLVREKKWQKYFCFHFAGFPCESQRRTCCSGEGGQAGATWVDGGQRGHDDGGAAAAAAAAGSWSGMSLSIHRRTGHGRALLLSTVCKRWGQTSMELRSDSFAKLVPLVICLSFNWLKHHLWHVMHYFAWSEVVELIM